MNSLGKEVAQQDIMVDNIINKIKQRQGMISNNYDGLKKINKANKIFQSVLDDYEQYYTYIKDEKQKQYDALKTISNYLDKLISNTDILKEKGEMLKNDQAKILKKIVSVRKELEDITK